jgi:O-acetyl-ADP-ribose deacetylase (regulator of RNase III)
MQKQDILSLIHFKLGDITFESTDAIVNAANPSLLGGGGVDGAIHKAAGSELLKECAKFGGCSHGEARITQGYKLNSKYIIHTPGPIYKDGKSNEDIVLANSYYNSMSLAKKNNCESISFPAISAGVYGYPLRDAARIAIDTVIHFIQDYEYLIEVIFVLFNKRTYEAFFEYYCHLKKI